MNISVSDESLRATTKCGKAFSCLKGNPTEVCRVEAWDNSNLSFVKCLEHTGGCNYLFNYGYEHILCSCPTRNELYRKHKV